MASRKATILLFTLLLAFSQVYSYGEGYKCNHDQIEQNPGLLDVEEDLTAFGENRHLASASNIRIYPYFGFLQETASSSYASYIQNELLPPIISYYQSALQVKAPVVGNLKLSSSVTKICERTTPSILTGTGVAADMFIYYDSEAISGTQIANSMYCYLTSGTKRPIVVRTMINRNMLPVANGDVLIHEQNMYVIMHELMHTLGFSNYQFPNFIDENGNRRTGHIKSASFGGTTHTVVDVPPLTDKLRTFFGCSTVPGAILENGGNGATDGSHFERKFFVYEYMSSGSILGRRVSQFSLAMLEGSGWYIPNYSYAEPYFFGQDAGCSFISGTCGSSTTAFPLEFCTGSNRGCAPHGRGGGNCYSDSIADGCRYVYPYEEYDCENEAGADYATLPELQTFGRDTNSKCFTGTLTSSKSSSTNTRNFCMKYSCTGTGSFTELIVQAGSKQITCTKQGQVSVSGYSGVFNCPDPQTFCSTIGVQYCPRNCMGRGTCVNNQCQCNSGYSGIDCALTGTKLP